MEITRINDYGDTRFGRDVLLKHGAFLLSGVPCSIKITGTFSAKISSSKSLSDTETDALIEEFRFFAEHICDFFAEDGTLIKSFPHPALLRVPTENIRPSQFYVSEEKLGAVASFVHSEYDVIIPVVRLCSGELAACDGHTRLYLAHKMGFTHVRAFFTADGGKYISDFAREAEKRGILSVCDMKVLSKDEYEEKWIGFCEKFFENLK